MTAHPDRKVVLVVASDGLPYGNCGGTMGLLKVLETARAATPSLLTYGISVFSALDFTDGRMLIDNIAKAGGTNQSYVLEENMNLTDAFLKALNEIRGAALPCEFMIPNAGTIDYGKVNLEWRHPAGDQHLGYVGSADKCDPQKGGWHYDMDPTTGGKPSRIVVCPSTCQKLKADGMGKVELRFGCKTRGVE